MTKLFAVRLSALGGLVLARGSNECGKVLSSGNHDDIENLLNPVNGIGPAVLRNFYILRGIYYGD